MSVRVTITEEMLKNLCNGEEVHVNGWGTEIESDVPVEMILEDIGLDRIAKLTGPSKVMSCFMKQWMVKDKKMYREFRASNTRHVKIMLSIFGVWFVLSLFFYF